MIPVTKTYLPPLEEYKKYLEEIWDSGWVTNRGKNVLELENKLERYLGIPSLLFVSNGTLALQIAIKALGLSGDIITTPFSYVATTNSIIWEGCRPVFADIDPDSLNIDTDLIEEKITPRTSAILATHVFGNPCDIEEIESIAKKYDLQVIYDGAHAFGVKYKNRSLLSYGEITITSFHATKIFHTIEGGGIISNLELREKLLYLHAFGHQYEDYKYCGINGKNSELHAAIGLLTLKKVEAFITRRKQIHSMYDAAFQNKFLRKQLIKENTEYNYSYYPLIFPSEQALLSTLEYLNNFEIFPRRYFSPSLNKLPYLDYLKMPISEEIAGCIACMPCYQQLTDEEVNRIITKIAESCEG